MGIALAIEAAHIAHFPNFKTHRKKTRITFIDREARREMDFFMGRYRHLFDLSEARFMDCEQDKTFHPAPELRQPILSIWNGILSREGPNPNLSKPY